MQCQCISKYYKKTTGSWWNYYRDEPSNPLSCNSKSFKYRISITENAYNIDYKIINHGGNEVDNPKYDANKVGKNESEVVIPLKYLSNFGKGLNIPLINCEAELILTWSKNCVLADITERAAQGNNPATVAPVLLEFEITDTNYMFQLLLYQKKWYKTFRTIKIRN